MAEQKRDPLTVGTAVRVRVGDGHIWRYGQVIGHAGREVVVDLGSDGVITASRDDIKPL